MACPVRLAALALGANTLAHAGSVADGVNASLFPGAYLPHVMRETRMQVARIHDSIDRAKDVCSKITECYCTKSSICGWCETTQKAMFGTDDGPYGEHQCLKWITWAAQCPTLHCSKHGEIWWMIDCAFTPAMAFLLWVISYCHRRHVRTREFFPPGWQVNDIFSTKRTYEAFRKAFDCPKEERLPETVTRPYVIVFDHLAAKPGEVVDSTRIGPHSFGTILNAVLRCRTSFGSILFSATGLMLLSACYLTFLRNAARSMHKDTYDLFAVATKDMVSILDPLQKAVSFLLSFYVLNRVRWYWAVMNQGWIIQGRAHDLAMIGSVCKQWLEHEQAWQAMYRLYRYIMLEFYVTYQPLTPQLRLLGFSPLAESGLSTPEEIEVLKSAHEGPQAVAEAWLATWIAETLQGECTQQAFQALRELRQATAGTQALADQRAPVSFESLLFVVVYSLLVILPFAPSSVDAENRRVVMEGSHMPTVFGTGILAAYYLALIHMLRHFQAPFDTVGTPFDSLNPAQIMMSTERKLRDYLSVGDGEDLVRSDQSSTMPSKEPKVPSEEPKVREHFSIEAGEGGGK